MAQLWLRRARRIRHAIAGIRAACWTTGVALAQSLGVILPSYWSLITNEPVR